MIESIHKRPAIDRSMIAVRIVGTAIASLVAGATALAMLVTAGEQIVLSRWSLPQTLFAVGNGILCVTTVMIIVYAFKRGSARTTFGLGFAALIAFGVFGVATLTSTHNARALRPLTIFGGCYGLIVWTQLLLPKKAPTTRGFDVILRP